MANFYSPNKFDPDAPMTCRCIPARFFVGAVQLCLIIGFLISAFNVENIFIVPCVVLTIVTTFFFFGTAMENVLMLKAHFAVHAFILVCLLIGAIIRLFYICLFTSVFSSSEHFMKSLQSSVGIFIFSLVLLLVYCYYLHISWAVTKYAIVKRDLLLAEPEFDTTQGLYQYNENAYDGKGTRLYPIV